MAGGDDSRVLAEKGQSGSHTEWTRMPSSASTRAKHSAKASASVIPSREGNSTKSPTSIGVWSADPGKVRPGNLRSWGLRGGDVHGSGPAAGGFHVGQSLFLGGIGVREQLHLDPVRIQQVDAAVHSVVDDVVDAG